MEPSTETEHTLWYMRRDGHVRGPYPAGVVSRYLLLGRLTLEDEISPDGQHWHPVETHPHLIPRELLEADTPEGRERLLQARMREDERLRERRAAGSAQEAIFRDQRQGDRRRPEPPQILQHRRQRAELLSRMPDARRLPGGARLWTGLALLLTLTLGALFFWGLEPASQTGRPDCTARAAPGVNWDYCRKAGADLSGADLTGARMSNADLLGVRLGEARLSGADLSYADLQRADLSGADLSGARMVGAVLRDADLSGARLTGADLGYADLRGADLTGAELEGVRLGHALWTDGRPCPEGAVGGCTAP
ncbi:Pentapeptide repeat-containing protein [Ectothiorhodospira mobilis]|uniref:Pentapeptide repeat-containing protein n=1 Tax=Ectothiorhodospira mobilis TaxID=195064 RepID=A0A1I4P9G5_ECTMO|nr:pentapeptide repeat-containing protein [Ectothiorhodospira mobilis]SFM24514.1 Pentapeptide repeat-containing protein [Ectothiorhodospira mobilis]